MWLHLHAHRVSNEWRTPAKLVRRVTSALRTYFGRATTCQLTRCSRAGQLKKFCACSKKFWWPSVWERVMTCKNVPQTCTAFAKRMRIVRRPCRACDDVWQNFTTRWIHVNAKRLGVTAALDGWIDGPSLRSERKSSKRVRFESD